MAESHADDHGAGRAIDRLPDAATQTRRRVVSQAAPRIYVSDCHIEKGTIASIEHGFALGQIEDASHDTRRTCSSRLHFHRRAARTLAGASSCHPARDRGIPEPALATYSIGGMRPFAAMAFEMISMTSAGIRGIATGDWSGGLLHHSDTKAAGHARGTASPVGPDHRADRRDVAPDSCRPIQ